MSYKYFDLINGEDLQRYKRKISAIGMKECPFRIPASCLKNNPLSWPPLLYPDIYYYLIESPGNISFLNLDKMTLLKWLFVYPGFH